MSLPTVPINVDYEEEKTFLSKFTIEEDVTRRIATLDIGDIQDGLVSQDKTPKYVHQLPLLRGCRQTTTASDKGYSEQDEVIDVILHQRRERNEQTPEGFQIISYDATVREIRSAQLGKLITVRGIVTRVSEVKPLLLVNAYTCDVCGSETFQDISNKTFNPIVDCQNEAECKKNGIHGSLHMQTRACRFSPFQEVKIQEMVRVVVFSCRDSGLTVYNRPIKYPSATSPVL
ncbi:Mcm2-7 hexameric complex component [Salix suchowensis]|nr:Mcm2-7 hexameric complex component [Salix suchowensis]